MLHYRFTLPMLSLLSIAAISPFEDTAHLDRQVAVHLSANIGDNGGARAKVDSKLKLKRCPSSVQLSTTNRNAVLVSCPDLGWRIFVPIGGRQASATQSRPVAQDYIVQRNQALTLVIKRSNFSISYGVVAQKKGRVGDYIPVRSSRKSKTLMARVAENGQVELAQ